MLVYSHTASGLKPTFSSLDFFIEGKKYLICSTTSTGEKYTDAVIRFKCLSTGEYFNTTYLNLVKSLTNEIQRQQTALCNSKPETKALSQGVFNM